MADQTLKQNSTQINSWHGLEPFGINYLTGEACGYSLRVLCDVNEDGKVLLQKFLGVELHLDPYNSSVNGKVTVNSIMLPYALLQPIAVFALLESGYPKVFQLEDGAIYAPSDSALEQIEKLPESDAYRNARSWSSKSYVVPNSGGRVQHAFTGRVE